MFEKTIIEVNGIKLEIDLRHAKRIDEFKIGDNIKFLRKDYSDYKSLPGVIVGFDNFEKLPTIVIAYIEDSFSEMNVKFAFYNAQSKDVEICHMGEHEKVLDRNKCEDYLNRKIMQKEEELNELKRRKEYFLAHYNQHFKSN